jgi:hypothetical protein
MGLIGASFRIELTTERCRNAPWALLEADGKTCKLVEHFEQSLYVSDIPATDEGDDGEYVHDGKLVVCAVNEGRVLRRTSRTRRRRAA